MRTVTLLDTVPASTNLGDQIIMEAVRRELSPLLADAFVSTVATHEWMGRKSRSMVRASDLVLAGGTNLLSSRMWWKPLWKLGPLDAFRSLRVTLMGVGWYQTQREPDLYTSALLRAVLDEERLHSVRDGYTLRMLSSAGIRNVVNTGCPTLWRLSPEHCERIPRKPAPRVVTTLNTYMPDRRRDAQMLETLRRRYAEVYFWTQTRTDYEYAASLDPDLHHLAPSLAALDALLESDGPLDYVGNRLHAGIRAMQKGRRTVIVEIDNRAREMGADVGLPTIDRGALDGLAEMVDGEIETAVRLDVDAIERFRDGLRR